MRNSQNMQDVITTEMTNLNLSRNVTETRLSGWHLGHHYYRYRPRPYILLMMVSWRLSPRVFFIFSLFNTRFYHWLTGWSNAVAVDRTTIFAYNSLPQECFGIQDETVNIRPIPVCFIFCMVVRTQSLWVMGVMFFSLIDPATWSISEKRENLLLLFIVDGAYKPHQVKVTTISLNSTLVE